MKAALESENICHSFGRGELAQPVLRGISVSFAPGDVCVLMGPSGSGKTTLLSILGCLLTPTSGKLAIDGKVIDPSARVTLCNLRRYRLGFVFQHAQLLPFLTVAENLAVTGRNAGLSGKWLGKRIEVLLDRLGIAESRHKKPAQLSGGQRQRAAIARAVLHSPPILLADEPTAALDWNTGQAAIQLLIEQAKSEGAMLLTVTHDSRLLPLFARQFHIADGRLTEQTGRPMVLPIESGPLSEESRP